MRGYLYTLRQIHELTFLPVTWLSEVLVSFEDKEAAEIGIIRYNINEAQILELKKQFKNDTKKN